MTSCIDDLLLPADDVAAVNASLLEAFEHQRSGALTFFSERGSVAWCGVVVGGTLVAQVHIPATSAEMGERLAQCLAHAVQLAGRMGQAKAAADAAISKIKG